MGVFREGTVELSGVWSSDGSMREEKKTERLRPLLLLLVLVLLTVMPEVAAVAAAVAPLVGTDGRYLFPHTSLLGGWRWFVAGNKTRKLKTSRTRK